MVNLLMKALMGLFEEAVPSTPEGCKKTTFDEDGVHAEIVAGDGFFSLTMSSGSEDEEEQESPQEKAINEELQAKAQACSQLRQEFYAYLKKVDEETFKKACGHFKPGELKSLQNTIDHNVTKPEEVQKATDMIKSMINQVIMKQIVALKSQMS